MNIAKIDYHSPQAGQQLVESFKNTGFAVIYNHPIPHQLFDVVKADWEVFFANEALKQSLMFNRNDYPQDGYFPTESAKGEVACDLKEFFHAYRQGPRCEAVSANTWKLFEASFAMGKTVMQWLQDCTPESVKQHFSVPLMDMMDPIDQTLLRILHYPPQQNTDQAGAIRAAAHEDINLITILPASDEPGLEAQDIEGNWHTVPTDPGMVIVNSGEMLDVASRGYYQATTHRVRNPSAERMQHSRYSFPLFVHAKSDVIIDTENARTQKELLIKRFEELGLR